jgi:pyrroline-5-carboxylate reductase
MMIRSSLFPLTKSLLKWHPKTCIKPLSLLSFNNFSTDSSGSVYDKITFIGAGKMAQALISPLIESNIQPPEKICVYDVSVPTMKSITDEFDGKIETSDSVSHAVGNADLIVMAVKPQNVCKVRF